MPRGDGNGPDSMGPMTGRGAGYCAGYSIPGFANPGTNRCWFRGCGLGLGRGFGRGLGFGRGFGFGRGAGAKGVYPAVALEADRISEREILQRQQSDLQNQLKILQQRLDKLEQ